MRARVVAVAIAVAVLAGGAGAAGAYPHYQLASGTDCCGDCHHAPAGGGLLTEWGRGELGETLARGGDGAFLHGLETPAWLAVGGDVRLAALVHDTRAPDGAEVAVFPMQLEAAARAGTDAIGVTAVVGLRGTVRDDGETGPVRGVAPFSREHVVSWQDAERTWVVRAGRFAAPFGLRLADHTAYVRRYQGFGLYEETYGVGVSRLREADELHVTAFVSDVVQLGLAPAGGAAVMLERRAAGRALRGSARIAAGAQEVRAIAGASGTWWLAGPAVAVLAELDGGWQAFPDAGTGRPTATAYLGPTWMPARGLAVTAAGELHADDVRISDTNRYAASMSLSYLPWAHVELAATARQQWIGPGGRASTAIIQLHYFP